MKTLYSVEKVGNAVDALAKNANYKVGMERALNELIAATLHGTPDEYLQGIIKKIQAHGKIPDFVHQLTESEYEQVATDILEIYAMIQHPSPVSDEG